MPRGAASLIAGDPGRCTEVFAPQMQRPAFSQAAGILRTRLPNVRLGWEADVQLGSCDFDSTSSANMPASGLTLL
jgi:hypothetical protein